MSDGTGGFMKNYIWVLFLTILILSLPTYSYSRPINRDLITGRPVGNYFTIEDEKTIGLTYSNQLKDGLRITNTNYDSPKDKAQLDRLNEIVQRLAKETHYPNFQYEIHIIDFDEVNAFCLPGGIIYVYSGLWGPNHGFIDKNNDDEIAAVLAHEIAHANARHATERITTSLLQAEFFGSIAGAFASQGYLWVSDLAYLANNIMFLTYNKRQEMEADKIGLIYMTKAGYDPNVAVTLWKKAASSEYRPKHSIFSTHPKDSSRAKYLEAALPEAYEALNIKHMADDFFENNKPPEQIKQKAELQTENEEVETLFNSGLEYIENHDYDNAINILKDVVKIRPFDTDAHLNLGRAYAKSGNKEMALVEYEILKRLDLEKAITLNNIISAKKKTGKYDSGKY